MSTIKIYINNKPADYQKIDGLPFSLTSVIGDIERIGSMGGVNIDNVTNLLTLPATSANQNIVNGIGRSIVDIKVLKSGKQIFNGRCWLKSKSHKNYKIQAFNFEVLGGSSDILSQLDGVSLRDLDCGTVDYTQAEIESSWTGDSSTDNGMFAPTIYGTLNSGSYNQWEVEDFRYHVYFETILNAIAKYLGITITSTFRTTEIWKRSVYMFGVGDLWRRNDTPSTGTASITLSPTTSFSYTVPSAAEFTIEVDIPSGQSGLDHIEIYGNGSLIFQEDYDITDGIDNYIYSIPFYVATSGLIEVRGKTGGDTLTNMPVGSMFRAVPLQKAVVGNTIKVSSCLHDEPVKNFLAAIFQMFNLKGVYNPIIKELILEPMFDYKIGATTYEGFYKSPKNADIETLNKDNAAYKEERQTKYSNYVIGYKSDDLIDLYLERFKNNNIIPLFGTKTNVQDGDALLTTINYFERLYTGRVNAVTFVELPVILSSETDNLKDTGNTILAPTFKSNPKCGYVSGLTTTITFEGASKSVPQLQQSNLRDKNNLYSLSFSDTEFTDNGTATDYKAKGLVSIFYEQLFAILRNFVKIKVKAIIKDILISDTYRKIYTIDNNYYMLISISNYELDSRKRFVDVELFEYKGITSNDADNTIHNALIESQAIVNIK